MARAWSRALERPRNKAHYEDADLFAQAGALYFGLAKNHGFLDGNKRIAVEAFVRRYAAPLTA